MQTGRLLLMILIAAAAAETSGCAAMRTRAENAAVRRFPTADRQAIFDSAAAALSEQGFFVDQADVRAGTLVSRPQFDVTADRGAPRRISGGRLRRIARVRVESVADTVNVYCRVVLQEQTTQAHRMLARDYEGTDTPTATPIERDAATTREQNTVWQTLRRDRAAEREILAAIGE